MHATMSSNFISYDASGFEDEKKLNHILSDYDGNILLFKNDEKHIDKKHIVISVIDSLSQIKDEELFLKFLCKIYSLTLSNIPNLSPLQILDETLQGLDLNVDNIREDNISYALLLSQTSILTDLVFLIYNENENDVKFELDVLQVLSKLLIIFNSENMLLPQLLKDTNRHNICSALMNIANEYNDIPNVQEALQILIDLQWDTKISIKQIMQGNNYFLKYISPPTATLMLFVSSTFTDSVPERNILLERVLPLLKQSSIEDGVYVSFIDMRYGVKDENTLNHETWIACRDEIKNCYDQSDGMFFLSLQNEKYGYCPLPKYINYDLFHQKLATMVSSTDSDLAWKWYEIDHNANPKIVVLKNLISLNDSEYWNDFNQLKIITDCLAFDSQSGSDVIVGNSVTEWETRYALRLDVTRCMWLKRPFASSVTKSDDPKGLLCDWYDKPEVKVKFDAYLSMLTASPIEILNNNANSVPSLPVLSYANSMSSPDQAFSQYIESWEEIIKSRLLKELDNIITKKKSWDLDGNGVGIEGHILDEVIHHSQLSFNKASSFEGREALVMEIVSKIVDEENVLCNRIRYGITLSLIGKSGCGKTAMMAKVAHVLSKKYSFVKNVPIVIRFCGTSKKSVHGHDLIISICEQIECIYNIPKDDVKNNSSFYDCKSYFHDLLRNYPVILFIDSLDQLSDKDSARRQLSFLDGLELNPKSRLIVSSLPDEKKSNSNAWLYCYLCDKCLHEANVPRVEIPILRQDEISILLVKLEKVQRCLTLEQIDIVKQSYSIEPTILYLTLASTVVIDWISSRPLNICVLTPTVDGLINQIVDTLSKRFGPQLVHYALAFITLSVEGVNDNEMQDLLSLCEDVLNEVYQWFKPEGVRQCPMHVWLRLKNSLKSFLVQRGELCHNWFHRKFKETIRDRYSKDEISAIHGVLGSYFSNNITLHERNEKLIGTQPFTLTPTLVWYEGVRVNRRFCAEAFKHLVLAESMMNEAIACICSLETVCGVAKAGYLVDFIHYIAELIKNISKSNNKSSLSASQETRLSQYFRWLQESAMMILQSPSVYVCITASEQPITSSVNEDFVTMRNLFPADILFGSTPQSWYRGITLGSKTSFPQCITTLTGHAMEINTVSFNHDGSRIISGSEDKTIKIWDSVSGSCIDTLLGHSRGVCSVKYSHDDLRIVSGSFDGTIKIWDSVSGSCIETFQGKQGHKNCVYSVCFSPDDAFILSGSEDRTAKIWDSWSGVCLHTLSGHSRRAVYSVSFCSDTNSVASASGDKTIKVWSTASASCLYTLAGHSGYVRSLDFSPNGLNIVSCSEDKTVRVWDLVSKKFTLMNENHKSDVHSVSYNHSGSRIASGSEDFTVKVWDSELCSSLGTLEGHSGRVRQVSFSPDDLRIISCSADKTIKVWGVTDSGNTSDIPQGHSHNVCCCQYSCDGSLIVSASEDKTVKLWDSVTNTCISTLEGHTRSIRGVHFSMDMLHIVSGSDDMTVKIWDTKSGACVHTLEPHHTDGVRAVQYSPDGLYVASGSKDKTIMIWNSKTWVYVSTLRGHNGGVRSLSFSPDYKYLASGCRENVLKIWDFRYGVCIHTLQGHTNFVYAVNYSPDSSKVVSGSDDKTMKIWDAASGLCLKTLQGYGLFRSVAFSPDGFRIASGSYDSTVRVWDAMTGECIDTIYGHSGNVRSVCFNPDGSCIVSGSVDKTIRVWESRA